MEYQKTSIQELKRMVWGCDKSNRLFWGKHRKAHTISSTSQSCRL